MAELRLRGLRALVQDGGELFLEDLALDPGELVQLPADPHAGEALADLLAGRGVARVVEGELELTGRDLLALTPSARVVRGLHAPSAWPEAVRVPEAFRAMLAEVRAQRAARGQPPLPTLTALVRTGLDASFAELVTSLPGEDDRARSRIAQIRLVEAPLAVLPLPEALGPARRDLQALVEERRRAGHTLLVMPAPGEEFPELAGARRLPPLGVLGPMPVAI